MSRSTIAICSIVRNCNKNLSRNIPVIESIRKFFKDSVVIVFENDSYDGSKETLTNWQNISGNVFVCLDNFGTQTIQKQKNSGVNRYFAISRIQKMAEYRNKYLQKLEAIDFRPDYLMVVDLDVEGIYSEGIIDSFNHSDRWDMIAANGYSFSPIGRKRFHDTFALVEEGEENSPQTEFTIAQKQLKWSLVKPGMVLQPVFSAHGGLSIYKYEAIRGLRYRVIDNGDSRVEARCEHYSMCYDMHQQGYTRKFVNPSMTLKYQTINKGMLIRYLRKVFLNDKD